MKNRDRQREIILQLKKIKNERELSTQDIYEMVKAARLPTSESSVRRVFADGSEEKNFRYQDTIKPIAQVLLGVKDEGEPLNPSEADALKNIALLKESMINELQSENDKLKKRIEVLEKAKDDYIGEIAFLKEQIVRKDDYIDRLAKKAGI